MTHAGKSRAVHVTPLRVYLLVGSGLLVLTAITVWAAQIDLGAWNIVIALSIAACKAILVALFFMHLFYDNKFFGFVATMGVLFLTLFISFTMIDTNRRGLINAAETRPFAPYAIIYDDDGKLIDFSKLDAGGSDLTEFQIAHGIGPFKEEIEVGPIDAAMAAKGASIFETKCATCHKLDKRFTGPALRDVTKRRSPTYVMNQMMNPDEMARWHPNGRKLLAEYMTVMTFQNVSKDDARAILEFLRREAVSLE